MIPTPLIIPQKVLKVLRNSGQGRQLDLAVGMGVNPRTTVPSGQGGPPSAAMTRKHVTGSAQGTMSGVQSADPRRLTITLLHKKPRAPPICSHRHTRSCVCRSPGLRRSIGLLPVQCWCIMYHPSRTAAVVTFKSSDPDDEASRTKSSQ